MSLRFRKGGLRSRNESSFSKGVLGIRFRGLRFRTTTRNETVKRKEIYAKF